MSARDWTVPLLDDVMRLHGNHGSGDTLPLAESDAALARVKHALATWAEPLRHSERFDECVRQLAIACLEEYGERS